MKKHHLKTFTIIAGCLFLLLLIANFGLNFWLRNKLPDFLKNNSDYIVSYKTLRVDLGTGNIFSTGISVNNKNPQNQDIVGLQGTIDTLSVSRFGMFDAVFRNKISSSQILLKNPDLNVIFPKPQSPKSDKKQNYLGFEDIQISNGKIRVFRFNKQKFFSATDLTIKVNNLRMTEESVDQQLPVVFDEYEIFGSHFFFRPDNLYAITAKKISTKNQQMNIRDLVVTPLLSIRDFNHFYPTNKNLIHFKTSEIDFKNVSLNDKKITLSDLRLENPELKLYNARSKSLSKKKELSIEAQIENLQLNRAKILIQNPDETTKFSAENLNTHISELMVNGETVKSVIPFQYKHFTVSGKHFQYKTATEHIQISSIAAHPQSVDVINLSVKPIHSSPQKTALDVFVPHFNLKLNQWKFSNHQLTLDAEHLLIDRLNGKITIAKNRQKKKTEYGGIHFPLLIRNIELRNSNLTIDQENRPIVLNELNAKIQNLEMNEQTVKGTLPFKTDNYSLSTKNFSYRIDQFYQLKIASFAQTKNSFNIADLSLKPTVSRSQFIRMIPVEKDLYTISVKEVAAKGNWDFIGQKSVNASSVLINGLNANIFRSKIPKDNKKEKPLYSSLLRSIKFPLYIQHFDVKNSELVYEEDTKKSDGPGKLIFGNFNLNARNINSGKMKGKPTAVPITINCRFMNASPMHVNWSFDTAQPNDAFTISGSVGDLPAPRINPFIEPYLKIRATGEISQLLFNFKGNKQGLNGTLNMKHQNLKVVLLKKDGKKNNVLSAVANIFVKSNSGQYPESVSVDHVERDPARSFFNLFWKGIEEGLKKTLLGKNIDKTEKAVKNTIQNAQSLIAKGKSELTKNETAGNKRSMKKRQHKATNK